MAKNNYSPTDLEYMASLSAAVLAKSPKTSSRLVWIIAGTLFWCIIWAAFSQVDEITRADGKIIPSNQIQVIQNLEGGIVSEILVKEGQEVEKGQILLKIDNVAFESTYKESELKLESLKAKFFRLYAEANGKEFFVDEKYRGKGAYLDEENLFNNNQQKINQMINVFNEQIKQKYNEKEETTIIINQLKTKYESIIKEVEITKPLYDKKIISEVEYIKLERQVDTFKGELEAKKIAYERINIAINELNGKINEIKSNFKNTAANELNEVLSEIKRLEETQNSLSDKVKRTYVKSPVKGTVNRLLINTISGVVKPGMDLIEIVPLDDVLLAEVKIKPSDIAFLKPGLKAMIKFTAYDFSIHGGLEGKLTTISSDTITNEKGDSFYVAKIATDKKFLGNDANPLKIITGMTVNVDIVTGKKSILDFILKPILKTKQNALRER